MEIPWRPLEIVIIQPIKPLDCICMHFSSSCTIMVMKKLLSKVALKAETLKNAHESQITPALGMFPLASTTAHSLSGTDPTSLCKTRWPISLQHDLTASQRNFHGATQCPAPQSPSNPMNAQFEWVKVEVRTARTSCTFPKQWSLILFSHLKRTAAEQSAVEIQNHNTEKQRSTQEDWGGFLWS